jgi:hypothetical protein
MKAITKGERPAIHTYLDCMRVEDVGLPRGDGVSGQGIPGAGGRGGV